MYNCLIIGILKIFSEYIVFFAVVVECVEYNLFEYFGYTGQERDWSVVFLKLSIVLFEYGRDC